MPRKTDWRRARDRADKAWALAAKHYHGFQCFVCGRTTWLQTHHRKPKATYPKLRYDLRNAVVLCGAHHTLDHPLSAHHDTDAFNAFFAERRPADHAYLADFKHNESIKRSPQDLLDIAETLEALIADSERVAA